MNLPKYVILVTEEEPGRGNVVTWPVYMYDLIEVKKRVESLKRKPEVQSVQVKTLFFKDKKLA